MTFSFIQITDHHLRESETTLTRGYSTWHAFRCVMRHIAQHHADADFIVSTGDLVNSGGDGDLVNVDANAQYQYLRRALNLTEVAELPGPLHISIEGLRAMPFYVLPGNLDPREAFFRNMFPSIGAIHAVGAVQSPSGSYRRDESPLQMNVVFAHKGVQFICVDWGAHNQAITTPAMLDFLAQALRNPLPSILLMHQHVVPVGLPLWDSWIADDIASFWAVLAGQNVLGIFSGHTHVTSKSRIGDVPIYGLRSTSYTFAQSGETILAVLRPPHYRVVTIANQILSTEIVEVPL